MTILTLQPNAAAGLDTSIFDVFPDLSFGAKTDIIAGTTGAPNLWRFLLQFDISSIPAGASIISAVLMLYCESEGTAPDKDVSAHRGLVVWHEGDGDFTPPSGDGSTWNNQNNSGPVAWPGGAGGVAGTEWTVIATDTTTITGIGVTFNWNVLADVVAWHGGISNYGWWLLNADEVGINSLKQFASSDNATPANRPKLVIEYTEDVLSQIQFANLGMDIFDGALI